MVTRSEHGKVRRKYYDYTLTDFEDAKQHNETIKREQRKFGSDFGNITDDEKRALDLWRQYSKEAMSNGFPFASAYEIMVRGLNGSQTTTPDFETLARLYFEKCLMRKTDGEMTDHAEVIRTRLFNHISPYFGNKPVHTITEDDVLAFLATRQGKQGKASSTTREQFLGLMKSVFKFAVEQGTITKEHNPVKLIQTVKQRKTAHSAFLKVLSTEAGVTLPKNCIRHTAASFMAETHGYTETANQLGHDIGMLLKHYRRAITKVEAEAFFNIAPDTV